MEWHLPTEKTTTLIRVLTFLINKTAKFNCQGDSREWADTTPISYKKGILYNKTLTWCNLVSNKLNNTPFWIPNFIDLLYKTVEWRVIESKHLIIIILREKITFRKLGHVYLYNYMYILLPEQSVHNKDHYSYSYSIQC